MQDRRNAGPGGIPDRRNAVQGGIQDGRYAGQVGFRTGKLKDWRDRQTGCKTGGMQGGGDA